jgi:hypothetical protein
MSSIREGQNTQDGGFWKKDWHTDQSIDEAIRDLEGSKGDGVSGEEMDTLLKSGADYGQISEREYSAMKRWVQGNWDRMSPEAQQKWAKFDKAMQEAGGSGQAEKHHSQNEAVIMSGAKLENLMKEIGETGKTAPVNTAPAPDGVDKPTTTTTTTSPDGTTTTTTTSPAHPEPSSPPAEPARPYGGGNSWMEILLALMDKIESKEQALKDKAKALNGKSEEEIGKGELLEIDAGMKEIQQMFTMVTNILQAQHDTLNKGLANLRV